MKPTRIWDLAAVFGAAMVVAWLLVNVSYSSLPPITIVAAASLYPVAAVEVIIALLVRARLSNGELGQDPSQLHPITAARAAVLAKASSLVGSAAAGVWLGFGLWVWPRADTVRAAHTDTPGVIVGLIGGIVLVAAALWLEHVCQRPADPPDEAGAT